MPSIVRKTPQPINPQWKQWQAACRKTRQQIKETQDGFSMHGEKWKYKMVRHYERQLKRLKSEEPDKYIR